MAAGGCGLAAARSLAPGVCWAPAGHGCRSTATPPARCGDGLIARQQIQGSFFLSPWHTEHLTAPGPGNRGHRTPTTRRGGLCRRWPCSSTRTTASPSRSRSDEGRRWVPRWPVAEAPPKSNLHREALPAETLEEPRPGIQPAILHRGHRSIRCHERRLQVFRGRTSTLRENFICS